MSAEEEELVTLMRVRSDMEAAIVVNALRQAGIRALATGGFTSGFQAEAPGDVKIEVLQGDREKARRVLDHLRHTAAGDAPDTEGDAE